jgi:hypothetical protein
MSAKWTTKGESQELLEMLKSAVQSMDDVGWVAPNLFQLIAIFTCFKIQVLSSPQDSGIQNAKKLAVAGATVSEN